MAENLARKAPVSDREAQHEAKRLKAVDALDILDSPYDSAYDRLTRLVRATFGVEMAMISVIDAHRQWYKATEGFDFDEVPVRETFCRRTLARDEPLVVENAAEHPTFENNPHVIGEGGVRFYAGIPLKTREGFSVGTLCAVDTSPREFTDAELGILEDLAAIVVDQMELRERARTDELTGILSRRGFREEGARLFALARREEQPLSVIVFDLDHFKSVNDTYGHAIGDKVLKQVARVGSGRLRKSDLLARPGGEEFAILLPGTSMKDAQAFAEIIRRSIEHVDFRTRGKRFNVSSSFGVATLDEGLQDLDALLVCADMALYQAKANGRNCVVAWGDDWIDTQAPRRRVLQAGTISFNAGLSDFDCSIRTIGADGAGLDLISTEEVPDRFELYIRSENRVVQCCVTARTATHLEVRFR
ncbi:MAG: sensor domain-containing diguanylate cyclase [Pseudomonadota bacterium]|nr:sensor domain-containing diguanylate cyclase [Pseudomonadota bacterium]